MSHNDQAYFKNLAAYSVRFFKVCLTILGPYALHGKHVLFKMLELCFQFSDVYFKNAVKHL